MCVFKFFFSGFYLHFCHICCGMPWQDKEYYPNIRRCLISGFFQQVACLESEKRGAYSMLREGQDARAAGVLSNRVLQVRRYSVIEWSEARGKTVFIVLTPENHLSIRG